MASVEERTGQAVGRWQVTLADLIVLVLGAGLAAGVVRGGRDVGAMPQRVAGVAVEVAAVFLALILARSMLELARRRAGDAGGTRIGRLAAMAWRGLAVALLIGFVVQESEVLRIDMKTRSARYSGTPGWWEWYTLREKLVPICAILAMFGLAIGTGAGVALTRTELRRPRPYWLIVPLVALAGVLIAAAPGICAMIPQLILIALEAVNNALPPGSRYTSATLSSRMLRAGIEAVPAGLAIVGLALIVARDFDRAGRSLPWARTRTGWSLRLIALASALAAGTAMAFIGIRLLSPRLFDGFHQVVDPEVVVTTLVGFGILAAGLSARAVVPRPTGERPRWLRRLAYVLPLGMLGIGLLYLLADLPIGAETDQELPPIVGRLLTRAGEGVQSFWDLLPDDVVAFLHSWLGLDGLLFFLTAAALVFFLTELAFRPTAVMTVPFDQVAGEPGRLVRFIWLTTALTVVCLAAIPTLIVMGQVILHIRLWISAWSARGWPSSF